jgi:uncharacterized protein (DUF2252 family)
MATADAAVPVPRAAPVEHLSPAERAARGKEARRRVPLQAHAEVPSRPVGADPVELLHRQAADRVPELVPIRYGRMLLSPLAFLRGSAAVMAADLAATAASGLRVQLCGDAHLANFGIYASPERRLVFDLNDFAETHPGPWEWDVKRPATSLAVAARGNGFTGKERRRVVLACVAAYRSAMRDFAERGNLEVWYASVDVESWLARSGGRLPAKARRRTAAALAKARANDSLRALGKLTRVVDGRRRIVSDPPVVVPVEDLLADVPAARLEGSMRTLLNGYRRTLQPDRRVLLEQYRLEHLARKVVGVGSVGTRAWVLLLLGRDASDPLFLQAKEAQQSVLAPYCGGERYAHEGRRVVAGQHLMQAASDIFLGSHRFVGLDGVRRDFYLRQLRDQKGSAVVEEMAPSGMTAYGRLCGWTLARAHARSGDRVAIGAYLGASTRFEEAVVAFAEAYADRTEADAALLAAAVREGRGEAVTAV